MDLKNPRQNPANFSHNHDCANLSTQKNVNKKKWLRIFGAGGLAFFMGVGTLCGVLLAPMGATSASNSGDPAALAQSADSALTPQEQLLAGTGLGLDPENDPVVFTTESGLDIKFGAATLSSGALSGYTYFTMGSYNGTAINWVIIGRHSSTTSGKTIAGYAMSLAANADAWNKETPYGATVDIRNWLTNEQETITAAGVQIDAHRDKEVIFIDRPNAYSVNLTLSSKESTSSTIDSELDPGEILVISEKIICDSIFRSSGNNYEGSILKTTMATLFESDLNFTDAQKKLIMPQYLRNYYYNWGSKTSYTSSAYLFPMGARGENFNTSTYLTTESQRVSYSLGTTTVKSWWTRSGVNDSYFSNSPYHVDESGKIYYGNNSPGGNTSRGVRPAMVLKLS